MRLMYDTTNIPAWILPRDAQIVAGYIDGGYRSFSSVVQACPNAVHVPIAVFPSTNGGQVLDCEQGDARPDQCPGWIKMRRAAGLYRPTIYTLASQVSAVKSFCAAAGLAFNVDWDLWSAHYDGWARSDGYGEVAKQFIDHGPHGENYDISAVFDDAWPHLGVAPPIPVPLPKHNTEESMSATEFKRRVKDDGVTPDTYTDETGKVYGFVYDAEARYVEGDKIGADLIASSRITCGPSNPSHNGQMVSIWSGTAGLIAKDVNLSAYYSRIDVHGTGRQSIVSEVPVDAWVDTVIVPV